MLLTPSILYEFGKEEVWEVAAQLIGILVGIVIMV
jgi:hypothetical protein